MPRKQYDIDPPDPVEEAPRRIQGERLDRAVHRVQMADQKDLANRLAALPQRQRRDLPMDEELQEQVDLLAAAGQRPDRRRLVMRVKRLLEHADLEKLEAAMAGDTAAAARDRECVRWRTLLLAGGDTDLSAFIDEWPRADRQALRTSLREARGQGSAATRANARILVLLREAMEGGA